jgi:hypothetical protein
VLDLSNLRKAVVEGNAPASVSAAHAAFGSKFSSHGPDQQGRQTHHGQGVQALQRKRIYCAGAADFGMRHEGDPSSDGLLIAAVENRGLAVMPIFGCPYPGCDRTKYISTGFDLLHQWAAEPQDSMTQQQYAIEPGMLTDKGDDYEKCF